MIEQILPDLYQIQIPLPGNPLRVLNSYFIRGKERDLLIDTGFNLDESWSAMQQALHELDVNMDYTDLFITHYHSDHIGLIGHLSTIHNTIWMSEPDANLIEANYTDNVFRTTTLNHLYHSGLLADGVPNLPEEDAVVKYASRDLVTFSYMQQGDNINIGRYHFTCIETPGHTQGHICLYDPEKKLFISGDHLLAKITPNIGLWVFNRNPLGEYLDSLEKTYVLDIDLVLPGHRVLITDHKKRIEELNNYTQPLAIAIAIGSPKTVAKIVSNIHNTNVEFPNIISPDTIYLDENNVSIGQGNIICTGCLLSCHVRIGNFNILNGFILIGHDSIIGDYNSFMPNTKISGEVKIGYYNFFGVGSTVLQQITIGNDTVVGANSVILRNTKNGMTYIGSPAKIMKY